MAQTNLINPSLNDLFDLVETDDRQARQVREIMPLAEWLDHPYYVGEDGIGLYDYWKEELINFQESGMREWIIFGSLGVGKTTAAIFLYIRMIYELSCWDPIPYKYGLMRSSTIYFIYFSIALKQAQRTGFGRFAAIIDSIPYFQKVFTRNPRITSEFQYRNLSIMYGSSVSHQIGMDLLATLLDEGDFFDEQKGTQHIEEFSKARDIYLSTYNRRQQRFSLDGVDRGLSILSSSPAYGTSFVEARIRTTTERNSAYVSTPIGYKVAPKKHSPNKFAVFTGNSDVDPKLIDEIDDLIEIVESSDIPFDSEETAGWKRMNLFPAIEFVMQHSDLEFEFVPENLRSAFLDDILRAVRDVCGKAIRSLATYMDEETLLTSVSTQIEHPFNQAIITMTTADKIRVEDYFDMSKIKLDLRIPRYFHIDQSITNDRTGIGCSLIAEEQWPEEGYPHVVTEFALAIAPPVRGEIPILRCAEFIWWLWEQGMSIGYVSMDSFQSRASLQYFESVGIPCGLRSVDRDDECYVSLRNMIFNRKHHIYDYPIYMREMKDLIWDRSRRKVDHPQNSSKDVTDGVCGSVQNALEFGGAYPTFQTIEADVEPENTMAMHHIENDNLWEEM